jgi:hypothetical protein
VVLVAVEALVVPLRPARVLVILGILGGMLLPSLRRLAGLDRLVLLLGVALLGHRHNRGVNDLAAARNVVRGVEMLAERSNSLSISPPRAKASRNSQIVVVAVTGLSASGHLMAFILDLPKVAAGLAISGVFDLAAPTRSS